MYDKTKKMRNIFDKLKDTKKQREESKVPKEDLNLKYGLPFNKIDDTYGGSDYTARFIGHDKYNVSSTRHNGYTFGGGLLTTGTMINSSLGGNLVLGSPGLSGVNQTY